MHARLILRQAQDDALRELFPSFPNSIWERHCRCNSIASEVREMEFREGQERSQMEFGNEAIARK
jgi:hypothetical protein